MFRYEGNILYVDLAKGKTNKKPVTRSLTKGYLGGRGVNIRLLYDQLEPRTDAFDSKNIIVYGVGPLEGTLAPACNQTRISSISPLTGILGDSSVGGHWGPELKYAGIDHLVVTGKAGRPVYFWIEDDRCEMRSAENLRGKGTLDTERITKEEVGDQDAQVLAIGPAGENLVRYAIIATSTYRVSGRTGLGAVMGSKNLKAIAVRGTKEVRVADPELFETLALKAHDKVIDRIKSSERRPWGYESTPRPFVVYRPPGYHDYLPQDDEWLRNYVYKRKTCFGCPRHEWYLYTVTDGPIAGTYGGNLPGNQVSKARRMKFNDWPEALKVDALAHDYGLDIDSSLEPVILITRYYEDGIVDENDLDGLKPEWEDYDTVFEFMRKITFREGVGDLLAEGSTKAARALGRDAEKYNHQIKGLDLKAPGFISYFNALALALSGRGGCHTRSQCYVVVTQTTDEDAEKYFGTRKAVDLDSPEGKPEMLKYHEDRLTVADSLGMCTFLLMPPHSTAQTLEDLSGLFNAATGYELGASKLESCGERILTLERMFNIREGLTREDDMIPMSYLHVDKSDSDKLADFNTMVDRYYQLRGWDQRGIPTEKTLKELKLKW